MVVATVRPTTLGRIASYYYLKYTSVALFCAELHDVDQGPTELSVIAPGQGPRLRELLEGGLEKELESEERMKPMLAI